LYIQRLAAPKLGNGSPALDNSPAGLRRTGVRVDLRQQVQDRAAIPKKRKKPADGACSDLPDFFAFS
jgi:hypothetical protein